jgi:toxin ParE1/3/4
VIYRVTLTPDAKEQLDAIYDYIAAQASPEIARSFTDAIIARCAGLAEFPHRGTQRDDLRPGVRTVPFHRRVTIAYSVGGSDVRVLGIFYGGQDYEASMREE